MRRYLLFAIVLVVVLSCQDEGTAPPEPLATPSIISIQPDSAAVGDTVRVTGVRFGSARGTSTVRIGSVTVAAYGSWTPTLIEAIVPVGAVSGSLVVTVDGVSSNAFPYVIRGTSPPALSFAADVYPIFSSGYGCDGCHNGPDGPNEFWYRGTAAETYALLMLNANLGCTTLQRVQPGNSSASVLYLRVSGSTCGSQMPKGGTPILTAHLNTIRNWIDQGAAQ